MFKNDVMQLLKHIHEHKYIHMYARVNENGRHEKIGACYEELFTIFMYIYIHIA